MKDPRNLKVLLIEDNPSDVLLLQNSLEADPFFQFELTHVERLADGLKKLKEGIFDIALVDLGLPDSSGLETFGHLHEKAPNLPIVVISGNEDEEQAVQAVSAGAQDYLVKSLNGFEIAARTIRYAIERQRNQMSLRESEARLKGFLDSTPDAMIIVNSQGRIILANLQAEHLFGYGNKQLLNQDLDMLIPERFRDVHKEHISYYFNKLNSHSQEMGNQFELYARHKDGREIPVEINLSHHQMEDEVVVLSAIRDITERKQAELALQEKLKLQEQLEKTASVGPGLICAFKQDANGQYSMPYASPVIEDIYGLDAAEIEQDISPLFANIDSQDIPHVQSTIAESARTMTPWHDQYLYHHPKKGLRWLEGNSSPVREADGSIVWYGIILDITERKQAEEKLRASEHKLRLISENMSDLVFAYDMDRHLFYANPAIKTLTGYSLSELQENNFINWLHPEDEPKMMKLMDDVYHGKGFSGEEFRIITKEGQVKWSLSSWKPLLDEEGRQIGIQGHESDITDRKQAEEKIRSNEERLRKILETTSDGFWIVDSTRKFLDVNEAYCAMSGYTREELLSMTISDIEVEESIQDTDEHIQRIMTKGGDIFDTRHRRKDGSIFNVAVSVNILNHENGIMVCFCRDITERKQAEEQLHRNEEVLRLFVEHSPASIAMFDREMRYIIASHRYKIDYRLGEQDITGRTHYEVFPETTDRQKAIHQRCLAGAVEKNDGHPFQRLDGTLDWVRWEIRPWYESGGEIGGIIFFSEVITERKQAEESLRQSEEKYRGLMESLDTVVATVDYEGHFLYMNDIAAEQLGGKKEELIGKTMFELFPEPEASSQMNIIKKVIEENEGFVGENLSMLNGKPRWYRTMIEPIHDENGRVIHALLNSTDIHDLKTAQQELSEWAETLEKRVKERTAEVQDLYDNAPAGYHSLDGNGRIIMINQTELSWLGYQREEMIGQHIKNFIDEKSRLEFTDSFAAFKERGWLRDLEIEFIRKDGSRFPGLVNSTAIYDQNGNYVMNRSTAFDITERKEAERAVRESQANLQDFLDTASDLIQSLDEEGKFIYVNNAWCEALGYTHAEALKLTMFDIVDHDFHEHCRDILTGLVTNGNPQQMEITFRTKTGVPIIVEGSVSGRLNMSGQSVTNGIFRNITKRKLEEESLQKANLELERTLHLKDEFLASMSHELRTPLTGILGLSEALQYDTYGELSEKQQKVIANIENNGRHLLELINDILDVSKMEAGMLELDMSPCSLGDICQASLQLIKGMAQKRGQKVSFSMNPASITMKGDARRLKQIIVNLMSNAIKYSPQNGSLGLDVSTDEAAQTVSLKIWDNGIGISPEDMERLFKPFVQLDSKLSRQQSGTGLGLALVQKLVDLHGGSIHVESTPNQGSRFTVILPYQSDISGQTGELNGAPSQFQQALVVEDSLVDSDRLTRFLRMLGINAVILNNGTNVIEKAIASKADVILLDLKLPDTQGWDVLEQLKNNEATRKIPVVITSVAEDRERAHQLGADGYLVKFFTLDELRHTLSRIPKPGKPQNEPIPAASNETTLGTIMIADDNETNVLMIEDYLRAQKYRVYSCFNGAEFLANVNEVRPDLVIMDIQMPNMDGLETTQILRRLPDPKIASVPVIAITALAMPGDRERCLDAGANEYLSKPIRLKELISLIQQMLKG